MQRITMKPRYRCKIISQRLTLAPFQSLAELFDGFASDVLCLLDFHDCSPVSGSSCSLHLTAREQGRETGDRSEEIGASRSERVARLSDTDCRGAKDASGDRWREDLRAGTRQFRSGKIGEQAVCRQVGKAETLARSTTRLRCASRRFVGRNGKAEAAKLPSAGIGPKPCPRW